MLSEYDFSKPPAVQSDLENDFVEVRPDSLPDATDVIRLHYRQSNSFISLADSYLEVAFTINAQADKNTLVNHVGSLFRRISMKINGTTIEQVENLNHVLLVKSMISFSDDYAKSSGSNMFYYHDTGVDFTDAAGGVLLGGADSDLVLVNPANVANDATLMLARENPAYNSGFVKRLARSKAGQVSCRVPLNELLSFCSVDKVLYNQEVEIELVKAPASEALFGSHAAGTVVVNTCNLWVNKRILDRESELTFLAKIAAGLDYDFEFLAHQAYLTGVLAQNTTTVRITTQSQKLISAFVMLVPSAYTQTDSKTRSMDNLTSAEMLLNNERYPIREYTNLDSDVGKSRTYQELIQMLTGGDKQSGISLTFDEYSRSTIIPFNFNSQKNFTGSPSVVELKVNTSAADTRAIVVLLSEKTVRVSYAGDDTVVTVL